MEESKGCESATRERGVTGRERESNGAVRERVDLSTERGKEVAGDGMIFVYSSLRKTLIPPLPFSVFSSPLFL